MPPARRLVATVALLVIAVSRWAVRRWSTQAAYPESAAGRAIAPLLVTTRLASTSCQSGLRLVRFESALSDLVPQRNPCKLVQAAADFGRKASSVSPTGGNIRRRPRRLRSGWTRRCGRWKNSAATTRCGSRSRATFLEPEKGVQRFYARRFKQLSEPPLEAEFATLAA